MNAPTFEAPTALPRRGDVLDHCAAHDVLIRRRNELTKYFADHAELATLVEAICKKVRATFGTAAELTLDLYQDPEDDDSYPTLFVRQDSYDSKIVERIACAYADFKQELEAAPGYFLVTTDFRRPGNMNVV